VGASQSSMFLFPSTALFDPFAKKSNNLNGPQLKPYTINRILVVTLCIMHMCVISTMFGWCFWFLKKTFLFKQLSVATVRPKSLSQTNQVNSQSVPEREGRSVMQRFWHLDFGVRYVVVIRRLRCQSTFRISTRG